mmetsp:Transcript_13893/g.16854  ORF Transcript_13893/g.16854 Transcript_13893/m.16854 type:complete len:83 (+) Transcript_13893:271-519(+)
MLSQSYKGYPDMIFLLTQWMTILEPAEEAEEKSAQENPSQPKKKVKEMTGQELVNSHLNKMVAQRFRDDVMIQLMDESLVCS